ncbi:MAG: fused MFS/spermidine synthase [Elusimicrobiota bacterium]|nr:MAG: fused MFS/spermidine synthase [Elusimicrobiota bacterium]
MPSRHRFTALAFLGSFLAFCLELSAAKLLLPRLGGTAFVWTGATTFFQAALLLSYLYARRARSLPRAHLILAVLPLFFFPLALPARSEGPLLELLRDLALTAGPAFFLLSTTVLVAQTWLGDEDGYHLYAASNAGAFAALFVYPLILEPLLPLSAQSRLWLFLYAAWAALLASCAPDSVSVRAETGRAATARERLQWLLLSAAPCAAMLAVTNQLSMNFAAVPLLWVLPLAAYLLTLVLNFKKKPWYPERLNQLLLPLAGIAALFAAAALWFGSGALAGLLDLGKFGYLLFALFALCMIFHRSLAARRPDSARAMGSYYAWMAGGGLAGSAAVALLVPILGRSVPGGALDWTAVAALAAAAVLARDWENSGPARAAAGAVAAGLLTVGWLAGTWRSARTAYTARGFYGVNAVQDADGVRSLYHGNTEHGAQSLDPARAGEPLSYYSFSSPLGDAWRALGGSWKSVGAVGLGAGTIAAYAARGSTVDFYELDPDVADIAARWFTYLSSSLAETRVILGDARLSLEAAATPDYDVLILDAFTSGAVPVHLLTEEAFASYRRRLRPGGVILVHVSNRYLDLRPALAASGRASGLRGVSRRRAFATDGGEAGLSAWVALSAEPRNIAALEKVGWVSLDALPRVAAWTDGHASLLSALSL